MPGNLRFFLRPGDKIAIEIEGIGTLENTVIAEDKQEENSGAKIAQAWAEFSGTIQLTPSVFDKLKSFIGDGMEEELIIAVMKYSLKQVTGNPFNYIISLLNDYLNRGILTLADYQAEIAAKEEGGDHERPVRRNYRQKEKKNISTGSRRTLQKRIQIKLIRRKLMIKQKIKHICL